MTRDTDGVRLHLLAVGSMVALAGILAADAATITLHLDRWGLAARSLEGLAPAEREWITTDTAMAIAGGAKTGFVALTIPCFLLWFFAGHAAVRRRHPDTTHYHSGWTIGGFLVPGLNLIRPCQLMLELWRQSMRIPAWPVWCWWGAFLAAGAAGRIAARTHHMAEDVHDLITASMVGAAADLLDLVAAGLALFLIYRMTRYQRSEPESGSGAHRIATVPARRA